MLTHRDLSIMGGQMFSAMSDTWACSQGRRLYVASHLSNEIKKSGSQKLEDISAAMEKYENIDGALGEPTT